MCARQDKVKKAVLAAVIGGPASAGRLRGSRRAGAAAAAAHIGSSTFESQLGDLSGLGSE